jgi:hypothetical protein
MTSWGMESAVFWKHTLINKYGKTDRVGIEERKEWKH